MKRVGIAMAMMAAGILAASSAMTPNREDEPPKKRLRTKKFDPADWREAPKKLTKRQARRAKGQNRRIID